MNQYYSELLQNYKISDMRARIYHSVIKEHKQELKKHSSQSREYKEIKEMIKFIKQMDDYKRVYKNMVISLFAFYRL